VKTQNQDMLNDIEKGLVAYAFERLIVGWTNCYMLEVRLDASALHILDGGDGLVTHGGNGSRCYAKHLGDPDWAVIHIEDEDWDQDKWLPVGIEYAIRIQKEAT
jgi:hypothetical protein